MFLEKNFVHNATWNIMQRDAINNICLHCPSFEVSQSVRKFCKMSGSLSNMRKQQIYAVTSDLILSANIIENFTKLCDVVLSDLSNSSLTALILVTSELSKHFLKTHDISKINYIIDELQTKIKLFHNQSSRRISFYSVLTVLTLLMFVAYSEILF